MEKNFKISHLNEIEAVKCPCGFTRRAFVEPDNQVASIHLVDIQEDAKVHYHKKLTEIYLILEAEGECYMELDGERHPVEPMSTILIKPGCRHRAVGKMKIVNIPVPVFDPEDEWFD
ncbi:MAG: cupin domain-containing protein [Verrucomicrobiota bacterium]